jgi:3-oxoacyl-[acyl-carrier-protein] synthase-3
MQSRAGIRQTAVVLGETIRTAKDLAEAVGAREDIAQRWLGNLVLYVSERRAAELGAAAARACLRRCNMDIKDVPFIVFGSSSPPELVEEGRRELKLQELLGAEHAVVLDVGSACSESITALRLAEALIASQPDVVRVLVVFGESRRNRILGYDTETYQPVFSDAGVALLIERGGPLRILGFGDATDGRYWNFISDVRSTAGTVSAPAAGRPCAIIDPRRLRLMTDSVSTNRTALSRCLLAARLAKHEIRHVLITREGPRIPQAMLRQLGLAADLLHFPAEGPTHAGMADFTISLDDLLANRRLERGAGILLGSRAVGSTRFCIVRSEPALDQS